MPEDHNQIYSQRNRQIRWNRAWYCIFLIFSIAPCFELALRILGYEPYQRSPYTIISEPSGSLIPDVQYGFALQPGTFQVKINDHVRYQATHGRDSFRITSLTPHDSARQAWLVGCSFTYGMGVDDTSTCGWLIQKQRPDLWIRNMGVPGHGTVQAWLRIQDQLARGDTPSVVIIMFSSIHMERNVLSPLFRRSLCDGFGNSSKETATNMSGARFPGWQGDSLIYVPWNELYRHWPGREWLASVQYAQSWWEFRNMSALHEKDTTYGLFHKISDFCAVHSIPLLVAGITADLKTASVLSQLERTGLHVVRTRVNLEDPGLTHAPYDSHPNEIAHRMYTEALIPVLNGWLRK